jgi:hypothetical protein
MNAEKYEKLLNSCTENCKNSYCFLKMFFSKQHPNEKVVIQLKCIEIAKWIWSAEVGEDIGWAKASEMWIDLKYAQAFSQVYDENLTILENFKLTESVAKDLKNESEHNNF